MVDGYLLKVECFCCKIGREIWNRDRGEAEEKLCFQLSSSEASTGKEKQEARAVQVSRRWIENKNNDRRRGPDQ